MTAVSDIVEASVEHFRQANRLGRRANVSRAKDAERVTEELKQRFLDIAPEITRIILFGSLAEKAPEDLSSSFDIDLAVEGGGSLFYRIVSAALDVRDFDVDVVDLDSTEGLLRERILTKGRVVYAANL